MTVTEDDYDDGDESDDVVVGTGTNSSTCDDVGDGHMSLLSSRRRNKCHGDSPFFSQPAGSRNDGTMRDHNCCSQDSDLTGSSADLKRINSLELNAKLTDYKSVSLTPTLDMDARNKGVIVIKGTGAAKTTGAAAATQLVERVGRSATDGRDKITSCETMTSLTVSEDCQLPLPDLLLRQISNGRNWGA